MKQILSIFAIAGATLMASCSSNDLRNKDAALQAQQNTIDSMKIELAKQQVIDSMNEVAEMQKTLALETQKQSLTPAKSYARTYTRARSTSSTPSRVSTSGSSSYSGSGYNQPVATSQPVYNDAPVTAPVTQQEKRGWSAKAKGAVIGGAAGAIGGAVINKRNRGAGAVIGGILGAGAGTGIGAIIDKKNGR